MAENRNKDTADGSPTLAEQLAALSPSPNLAKLLEEINGNSTVGEILKQQETAAARISEQLRASSAAAEWVHSQDSAAARIREQLAASLNFEPAYQDALFGCKSRRNTRWYKELNSATRLIQSSTSEVPRRLCTTSDSTCTRRRSAIA